MIRLATADDAGAIAEIYNEYVVGTDISFEVEPLTVERMSERILSIASEHPYYVYADDATGAVEGFCYAHPWKERRAYYHTLETTVYVASGRHGEGIGRQLMQRLIDECRRRGFVALIACITADNRPSIEFHRRMGFHLVSHFEKVGFKHGHWLDVVDMELMLCDPPATALFASHLC